MKTEQKDSFWKWYGFFFAAGAAACLILAITLLQFRPKVDIEAFAAVNATSTEALGEEWWYTSSATPTFSPW